MVGSRHYVIPVTRRFIPLLYRTALIYQLFHKKWEMDRDEFGQLLKFVSRGL